MHILMKSSIDEGKICKIQPLSVSENASFIIDNDEVNFQDLKADDLGSWKTTGTKKIYFRFANGIIRLSEQLPNSNRFTYFVLTRRYYVHQNYEKFHRQIVDIKGIVQLLLQSY